MKWVEVTGVCGNTYCQIQRQIQRKRAAYVLRGSVVFWVVRGRLSKRRVSPEESSWNFALWRREYSHYNVKRFHKRLVSEHRG